MDYALNRRFFAYWVLPIVPIALIAIGLITAIVGLGILFTSWTMTVLLVGMVLCGAGTMLIPILNLFKPKGERLDGQVQEEVTQLHRKALDKHGIAEEMVQRSPPLVFGGYIINEKAAARWFSTKLVTAGEVNFGTRPTAISSTAVLASVMSASVIPVDNIAAVKFVQAGDGIIRSALAEYTVFLFSEEKVFVYTRQFSLLDPEIKESAQVFSYRDIVSVSSETSKYGAHAFIVKASGGTTLTVPSSSSAAGDIKGSVTAFMQLVREKKST
ncbi:MAG: hypothetical protein LBO04_08535 [Spirochaetaceae bacterium]|nr:hypothetical protein [Spirochaetaceae bacterium]